MHRTNGNTGRGQRGNPVFSRYRVSHLNPVDESLANAVRVFRQCSLIMQLVLRNPHRDFTIDRLAVVGRVVQRHLFIFTHAADRSLDRNELAEVDAGIARLNVLDRHSRGTCHVAPGNGNAHDGLPRVLRRKNLVEATQGHQSDQHVTDPDDPRAVYGDVHRYTAEPIGRLLTHCIQHDTAHVGRIRPKQQIIDQIIAQRGGRLFDRSGCVNRVDTLDQKWHDVAGHKTTNAADQDDQRHEATHRTEIDNPMIDHRHDQQVGHSSHQQHHQCRSEIDQLDMRPRLVDTPLNILVELHHLVGSGRRIRGTGFGGSSGHLSSAEWGMRRKGLWDSCLRATLAASERLKNRRAMRRDLGDLDRKGYHAQL